LNQKRQKANQGLKRLRL